MDHFFHFVILFVIIKKKKKKNWISNAKLQGQASVPIYKFQIGTPPNVQVKICSIDNVC